MIRLHLKPEQTRAPNALSGLANKAFKVIVSCLMCDGQDKPRLSAVIKLPGVMTPFLILSLSCPECGYDFSCSFIYVHYVLIV